MSGRMGDWIKRWAPAVPFCLFGLLGLACYPLDPPPRCEADLNFCEVDEQCHECCIDDHCGSGEICDENKQCVAEDSFLGEPCGEGRGDCPGLVCDVYTMTCMYACQSDADCVEWHPTVDYYRDMICKEDRSCGFLYCSSDADCPEGKICYNADCITAP